MVPLFILIWGVLLLFLRKRKARRKFLWFLFPFFCFLLFGDRRGLVFLLFALWDFRDFFLPGWAAFFLPL